MAKYQEMNYQALICENIRKILNARGLDQVDLVDDVAIKESMLSNMLNGKRKMSVDDLANIARALAVRTIDLLTYPDVYEARQVDVEPEPVEAILQVKLKKDKKDQVLKLVFGENNIEILNK